MFAFETHFGEPVLADIYYDSKSITKDEIRKLVENPEPVKFSETKILTYHFKVNGDGLSLNPLTTADFKKKFFPYVRRTVDKDLLKATQEGIADSDGDDLSTYLEIPLSGLDDPFVSWSMPKIAGHLKALDGLLQVRTGLNEKYQSVLKVWTIKGTVTSHDLLKSLSQPQLKYHKRDEIRVVPNPFKVTGAVRVIDSVRYRKKGK